ncbi:FUSC family membrane protein [Salinimicrobium flavum]|uniref:FUSC family membrane protein n=1 Tax=Salinimicrobium flavum TaxID=1737065 RepID=A0ABW5IZX6_9FLAO
MDVGIAMSIGVLLTSPSDVPGSLRRRLIGVSLSALMAVVGTLLAGYAAMNAILFVPVLALLIFSFSMISVYGFRASLISFSGLFAVVLSLAKVPSEISVLEHSLLVGLGGLWYLVFTITLHYLNRRRETEKLLAEVFELTAEYLEIRTRLFSSAGEEQEKLQKELIGVQTDINEKHETLRELVISRRRNFGRSGVVRKKLLIFMELVDILELGMANPVNYIRMQQLFRDRSDKLEAIKKWSIVMAAQLREIALVWKKDVTYRTNPQLEILREDAWQAFRDFEKDANLPQEREALLVYRNLLVFKDKQDRKIKSIERLLREWEGKSEFKIRAKEAEKFITTRDYDLKTLENNLDLKSPIFRHSLRLLVVLVAGFFLGRIFHFQNAYWILLTSLVIMRPGYALTRERFQQRLYGTLIGGGIAVTIVLIVQNTIVYGILAVITLILAFSMIQRNYKTAAAFITLNVVFVYSLIRPDVLEVIQYRVLDTIIGAALAFVGNKFLWPTWEYSGIKNFISESLKANREFLNEISVLYREKGRSATSYRLARKRAFLAIGDLNAAFQRMAQEPRSGEGEMGDVFKMVSLNQEFLSSVASLGTFIRAHSTTTASTHFLNYTRAITENLLAAERSLQEEEVPSKPIVQKEIEEAEIYFSEKFKELTEKRNREKAEGQMEISPELREQLQEVQIITDQLKWLWELSENLKALLSKDILKA